LPSCLSRAAAEVRPGSGAGIPQGIAISVIDGEHAIVVRGYSGKKVWVNDPWGGYRYMTGSCSRGRLLFYPWACASARPRRSYRWSQSNGDDRHSLPVEGRGNTGPAGRFPPGLNACTDNCRGQAVVLHSSGTPAWSPLRQGYVIWILHLLGRDKGSQRHPPQVARSQSPAVTV